MTHSVGQDIADGIGATSSVASIYMWISNRFNLADFNEGLLTITAIVGLAWAIYRVILVHLQVKGEKLENKKKKLQIKELEGQSNERDKENSKLD